MTFFKICIVYSCGLLYKMENKKNKYYNEIKNREIKVKKELKRFKKVVNKKIYN